ncbi:MAG: helix-turn-helix transcriptional regulator [Lachnospiraceae bacterium]|nr:helix-turn-helix transcriptional regulator [uncultured Acetatifactor sp.]MCI9229907.1 helix-turn-helix transcriptional regulator [Lachnospiraceae bacterium]
MNKNEPDSVARNIKKYRLLNNMTQEELAQHLNLDPQYYAQLERGERNFTLQRVVSVCSLFHIGIEDIIHIPTDNADETQELLQSLHKKMGSMSYVQLLSLDKFIEDIVPYIK